MIVIVKTPEEGYKYCKEHAEKEIRDTFTKVWADGIIKALEPELKTGWWIAQDIHNCHTTFRCSECGYIHSFMHLYCKPTADYTYCPNCGAKMVEHPESEDGDND